MGDARLPTAWSDLLQSIKPFGESDLTRCLTSLRGLLEFDGARLDNADGTLARIGIATDFGGATVVELEYSEATLRLLHRVPFADEELVALRSFASVLDMALLAPDRRLEQIQTPMIAPFGGKDRLTQAIDRDAFADHLDIEFAAGPSSASIIVLGMDGLGIVNDTLGHTSGDVVLAATADRLRDVLRSCDVVSRLGGDVFGIYCPNMGVEIATKLTRRLQDAVSAPISVGSNSLRVTASAGIASRSRGEDAASTLSHGDLALQSAKSHGANQLVIFDGALQMRVEDRRSLATEFVDALAKNELTTSLEPIVHLPAGTVVGVEAKVAWNHPTRGQIDRNEFIDLAELIGRVSDVERAVLEFALVAQGLNARSGGTGVTLSASTLQNPLAVSWIVERLESADNQVIIEVGEPAVSSGGTNVIGHLSRLREAGASIVLNDFGLSVASIRTLHAYAFDGVKLHHSLISEGDARRGASIIRAVYASAKIVGFDVVHTGIDTDRDLGMLLSIADSISSTGIYAQGAAVRARARASLV